MRYRLEDLHVDLGEGTVRRGAQLLDVKGLSFRLLAFLLEQGTRVVGFDELMTAVWSPAVVNEETVTQRVRLLRAALGDDVRRPRYIRSVRGQGYQLCNEPRPEPVSRRLSWRAAAAVAVLSAAIAAVSLLERPENSPASASDSVPGLLDRAEYYAGIAQAENNARAIAMYEHLLKAEPDNERALLGLSFALSAGMCLFDAPPAAAERAAALAQQVLRDNAENARAHAALAYSLDCRGLIDAAIASYERAVALNPAGRRDSVASAAHLYAVKGRLADALRMNLLVWPARDELRFLGLQVGQSLELLGFRVAAERRYAELFRLYPDSVFANLAYPRHLFTQGRLNEAEAVLAEALKRPARPELLLLAGELELLRGERARAREYFLQAATLREHLSMPRTLAGLYAAQSPEPGWFADRIGKLEAAIAGGDRWPENWLELALLEWHHGDGDARAAVAALRAAVDHGYRDAAYLRASPLFKPLAEASGFAAVIDRIERDVARQRDQVLAADWLPAELTSASR